MKVIILTEGGKYIGYGHLTRCNSIYQAFIEKGITPDFIVNGDSSVKFLLDDTKFKIFDWLREKKRIISILDGSDVVIIDSYLADLNFYRKISVLSKTLVYIDDNIRLNYPGGIILNGTIGAEVFSYPKESGSKHLLGTKYIPLRKEFWKLPNKRIRTNLKTVLVTFGGTDNRNLTYRVLRVVAKYFPQLNLKCIVNKTFMNLYLLEALKNKNIEFIYSPKTSQIRKLMLDADIAISAAGQTLYELARLGVPTIPILVAENQENSVRGWENTGFIKYTHYWNDKNLLSDLTKSIQAMTSYSTRKKMSRIGSKNVDGNGSRRIIKKIMEENILQQNNIKLRKANKSDCHEIWVWRNHPEVRRWSLDEKKILYRNHKNWFINKLKTKKTVVYIAENKEIGKIGQIRFEINSEHKAHININLNPQYFGKGFGSLLIRKSTSKFLIENPSIKVILAEIIRVNTASLKAFRRCGYLFYKKNVRKDKEVQIFKFTGK